MERKNRKATEYIGFAVLLAIFVAVSVLLPRASASGDMIAIGSARLPVSAFTGVLSALSNMCIICLVVYYGRTGFITAMCALLIQFPFWLWDTFFRRTLTSIPGASINLLTVIASESYTGFVAGLQSDIKTVLYDRPTKATIEYFTDKVVMIGGAPHTITAQEAKAIQHYLIRNVYINVNDEVTDLYRTDLANHTLAALPVELSDMEEGIHALVQAIFDDSVLAGMTSDGHKPKVRENPLNDNFYKKEFQTLWGYINHKYAYTVEFDSAELVQKCVEAINQNLFVSELQYTTSTGAQKDVMVQEDVADGNSFASVKTRTHTLKHSEASRVRYDLIGKIADPKTGACLTRKTVAAILAGLSNEKLAMFRQSPEEFITRVIGLIKEQKAAMIVDHITYDKIDGSYDNNIFTAEKSRQSFDTAYRASKAIQDYIFTDGYAQDGQSIERKFAQDLDAAQEVCVYAKLPKGFSIPTPVGNYSPDWAIAFNEGTVKHIYFIAETKGTMESMHYRRIEDAKIDCAKKLFNTLSTSRVKYHNVDSYQNLLAVMNSL